MGDNFFDNVIDKMIDNIRSDATQTISYVSPTNIKDNVAHYNHNNFKKLHGLIDVRIININKRFLAVNIRNIKTGAINHITIYQEFEIDRIEKIHTDILQKLSDITMVDISGDYPIIRNVFDDGEDLHVNCRGMSVDLPLCITTTPYGHAKSKITKLLGILAIGYFIYHLKR
jgi:hypothetical protein